MSQLMQTLQGGIQSLGNMFGQGTSALPPSSLNGVTDSINMPSGSAITNPGAIGMPSMSGMDGSSMDALTQAVLKQTSMSPWLVGAEGLGNIGTAILQSKLYPELKAPAPATHGEAQQPQALQFAPPATVASPLSTAALIAQLL